MTEPQDDAQNTEAAADAGATAGDDAQNASVEENKGKLIQSLQNTVAESRRERDEARAELERVRKAQSPAAPNPHADSATKQFREAVAWASGERGDGHPDEIAAVTVRNATDNAILAERLAERDALDEIEDGDTRKAVKKELEALKREGLGGAGAVDLALKAVKAAQVDELQAENERLRNAFKNAQATPGAAPQTHSREMPASQLKPQVMTAQEAEDHLKTIRDPLARMAFAEDIEKGMKGQGGIRIKG